MRRSTAARALAAAACAAAATGVLAAPAAADPESTAQAREQVDAAHHAAEQALERYLTITDRLKDSKAEVSAVSADVERQQKSYDRVRAALGSSIASQLTDSPMGPTAQLLASDDPDAFLGSLSAMQTYQTHQSDQLQAFTRQAAQLKVRRAQLAAETQKIATARADLKREKDTLDTRAEEAEETLASLTAAQRAAVDAAETQASGGGGADATVSAGSIQATGKAKKAIAFALAQVGDAYVYGATGPSSWDCSGLTGGAWRAAGVSLPRSSSQQAGAGSPVSRGDLSPGDLVFYYSPISHVGLYIGDGRLVHAPRPGRGVEVVSVDSMPISTIRRVG